MPPFRHSIDMVLTNPVGGAQAFTLWLAGGKWRDCWLAMFRCLLFHEIGMLISGARMLKSGARLLRSGARLLRSGASLLISGASISCSKYLRILHCWRSSCTLLGVTDQYLMLRSKSCRISGIRFHFLLGIVAKQQMENYFLKQIYF